MRILLAGGVGAHVDHVEGMELNGPLEMARSDHVDLVDGARLWVDRYGVGHTLRDVSGLSAPWPGQSLGPDDPFDGPAWRHGLHAHAPQLPGHGQRSVLGPRVGHQAGAGVDDGLTQVIGEASG